jgi:hypothetical protein
MSLDLNKLEKKLDEALSNETTETLNKFLNDKSMKNETKLTAVEWLEHFNFYLDNLQDNEIPLSFEFWKNEYENELIKIIKSLEHKK